MRLTHRLESSPAFHVVRLFARFERHRRPVEQWMRLGSADQRLMWLFSDGEGRTLKEIAEALGLEQSTVNRQVNAALREGLLERSRHPGQSAAVLSATGEGHRLFREDLEGVLAVFGSALEALPAGDRDGFLRSLGTFVDAFGAAVDERLARPGG
ncbi:MarR family winged helix-turn-helix transcriptional regulator [Aeromicrobium flavum]|uniref:MarR family winged helix-turn-helix transcriptional regulator n=1 Tax=Aeromicrobium flavum TaxID=416568 RepID=UPI0031D9CFC8